MDNDDDFAGALCRANNDISYDEYRDRIRAAQDELAEALTRIPGSQREIDTATRRLVALRRQTHPDMWHHDEAELSLAGRQGVKDQELVRALWTCKACPVRLKCLDEGMRPENVNADAEDAVFGGYTTSQRRQLAVAVKSRREQD